MKKYNNADKLIMLEPKDDAATVNWDEGWKMPTKEQFQELMDNTEYEWTEVDGIQGAKFTSKIEGYTDRFLFFPAVGDAGGSEVYNIGDYGLYWSVSLNAENVYDAWGFDFGGGRCKMYSGYRCYGYSVRPVRA